MYFVGKMAFLIWCMAPIELNGSDIIYKCAILPFFIHHKLSYKIQHLQQIMKIYKKKSWKIHFGPQNLSPVLIRVSDCMKIVRLYETFKIFFKKISTFCKLIMIEIFPKFAPFWNSNKKDKIQKLNDNIADMANDAKELAKEAAAGQAQRGIFDSFKSKWLIGRFSCYSNIFMQIKTHIKYPRSPCIYFFTIFTGKKNKTKKSNRNLGSG